MVKWIIETELEDKAVIDIAEEILQNYLVTDLSPLTLLSFSMMEKVKKLQMTIAWLSKPEGGFDEEIKIQKQELRQLYMGLANATIEAIKGLDTWNTPS